MNARSAEKLKGFGCVGVLVVLAALFFHSALFSGRALGPYELLRYQYPWGLTYPPREGREPESAAQDFVHQVYPWRHLLREGYRSGRAPLWNPHQMCGTPFAANDQSAVFYPLNAIYVLLPVWKAFEISTVVHVFLAGLFMFFFVRVLGVGRVGALSSGVAFMFTGWITVWTSHAAKLDAAVWAPLVFAFFELSLRRRSAVWPLLCAAALGVQFTAGFLQVGSYTAYGVAIYALIRVITSREPERIPVRRALFVVAVVGVVSILLAAVHVFQVLDLASQAQREMVHHSWGFFPRGMPPRWAMTALLPGFFGEPNSLKLIGLNYTEYCCFAGASALCLALVALSGVVNNGVVRRRAVSPGQERSIDVDLRVARRDARRASAVVALSALAILGLLSAWGTPLYLPFYYLVPGAKLLAVNRIIFLFSFGVAALSGFGVETVSVGGARRASVRSALLLGIIASALALIMLEVEGSPSPASMEAIQVGAGLFFAYVFGITVVSHLALRLGRGIASAALFMVILFEFFQWGAGFTPVSEPKFVFPETPSLAYLRDRGKEEIFRVHVLSYDERRRRSLGPTLYPNTATVYGLDDIRGYDSLYLKRYQDFVSRVHEHETPMLFHRYTVVNTSVVESKWIDFMNVKYLIGVVEPEPGGRYAGAFRGEGDVPVYVNTAAMPRAMVLRDWVVVDGDGAILDEMMRSDFDPSKTVVLESAPPGLERADLYEGALGYEESGNAAEIVGRGLNDLTVRAAGPGLLVLSETYAPGWRAAVNGRPTPVLRANYTFRAVPLISPGENVVELTYRPASAAVGTWVSVIVAGILCIFFVGRAVLVVLRKREG